MDEDILRILTEPTVNVAVAARVLGISVASAYKARAAGEIPSFKVGGVFRVPTSPLRQMLQLPDRPSATMQAAA